MLDVAGVAGRDGFGFGGGTGDVPSPEVLDFVDVDFAAANLRLADLRASSFVRVMFTGADLRDADLRRSDFIDCRFDGALVDGMKLARGKGQGVLLSEMQRTRVAWQDDEGEEPDGG